MKNTIFKKSLFAGAILLGFSSLQAQTIPGSAFPTAGQVFSLTGADTTGVSAGAGGMNATWNFGSLVNGGGSQVDSFLNPSATPYGTLFPSATVALHQIIAPVTNTFVYFRNNIGSSVYERIANVKPDTVIYQTPAKQYPYPLTPSTTYSGNYYAHYRTPSGSATEAGVISGGVDGTGTLTLPTGTYTNVIRSHYTRTEQDTTYTTSTNALVQVIDYYEWYQPNSYFPILSISTTTASTMGFTVFHKKNVGYRQGYAASGIDESSVSANKDLMVFPNPANTKATLIYDMKKAGEAQINIYDLTGRLVQSISNTSGEGVQTLSLTVSELPIGMYEVRVTIATSSSSVKLQITK